MWSFALAALSIVSALLLARKKRSGWLAALATNTAWIIYAIVTTQPGFLLMEAVFVPTNVYGYRNWRPERSIAGDQRQTAV